MTNELKIEYYLSQLDRELSGMPTSQRAEIITEIKSHIFEAMQSQPNRDLEQVFEGLGSPHAVAERYLVSKGLPLKRPSNRGGKVFKWLAIGTVGFFAFIFLMGMAAIWYMSPIIKVDKDGGRVALLGGLIDIDEEVGQVKIGDMVMNGDFDLNEDARVEGEVDLNKTPVTKISLPFNTARLEIHHGTDDRMIWDCRAPKSLPLEPHVEAGTLTLNLSQLNFVKCKIILPISAAVEMRGTNGKIDVDFPFNTTDIELDNGKVSIRPDPSKVYDFEVKVKNGLQDFFPRSLDKKAVKVKVNVVNGVVKKE